jgi:hypothetical protein
MKYLRRIGVPLGIRFGHLQNSNQKRNRLIQLIRDKIVVVKWEALQRKW